MVTIVKLDFILMNLSCTGMIITNLLFLFKIITENTRCKNFGITSLKIKYILTTYVITRLNIALCITTDITTTKRFSKILGR